MNTLIHLWPARNPSYESAYAILDTPMFPARFYFGPVQRDAFGAPNDWIGLDNATYRYHATLKQAIAAADVAGFNTTDATYKAVTAPVATRAELEHVVQRLAALRTDAGLRDAISYLPELASLVDHAEAVLKGAPFEALGYAGGGGS